MKNITLLIAFLATCILNAQNFPGLRPELLNGKEVSIIPLEESDKKFGYNGFFTDLTMYKKYAQGEYLGTLVDSLVGQTFIVEKVEPYKDRSYIKAKVTLKNKRNNKILYYSYNSGLSRPTEYPFEVVGGLDLPADFYCDDITYTKQEGTAGQYRTNMEDGIAFIKYTVSGHTFYMVELREIDKVYVAKPKNAVLVLENNKTISKPDATIGVVSNNSGSYIYNATFHLEPAEVELLTQHKIISGKIHTFEDKITAGEKIKGMFGCLVTK